MFTIDVELVNKSYQIYIQKGLLNNIGKRLKSIYMGKKIAIVTDANVEGLYGDRLRNVLNEEEYVAKTIVLEPGEKSKSIQALQRVYNELLDFKITRGDMIIAFGGGVIGDLGGFASSTLLRGIPFLQIPTTLLSQIDSSIGGKVGINLPRGKNLIGSFYHPEKVFIDPELLNTLEERFLYDGMAEVIKYSLIRDRDLFEELIKYKSKEELLNNIEKVIYKCCNIKKEIVEKDERDTGERMILNFGHTLGHGIEKYFQYNKYTHGEAVAIGMYNITKNSEAMGITHKGTLDLIEKILNKYKLPFEMPKVDRKELLEAIALDKKSKGNDMNIVLLENIGKGFIKKIDRKEINKYL